MNRPRLVAWIGLGSMVLVSRAASAELTIDHEPGIDGCSEAAFYFPEDDSPEAQRARRRCRLERFERKLEDDRARDEAVRDTKREQTIAGWMDKQEIPVRVMHRNSVDLFLSGGLASYGVAVGGLLLPVLEAELWVGRRSVSESTATGFLWDSRTCLGGRFKWLTRSRGNLTPFASLGVAGCSAHLQSNSYNYGPVGLGFPDPGASNSAGDGAAHLVTASAGLAWMEKSGVRVSLEYVFAYAFYAQATLNDEARTEDANLRAAWESRLTSDRRGVRVQVGYAF